MTEKFEIPSKARNIALALMGLGVLGIILGFVLGGHGHDHEHVLGGHDHHDQSGNRVWANLLINSYYFIGLAVTGLFLTCAHQIGYGGWHIQIKRVWESTGAFIPVAGLVMIVILIGGKMHWHTVYHWMDETLYDPTNSNYDKVLAGKQGFLNFPFFTGRILFYIIVWSFFAWLMRKISLQEDQVGGLEIYKRTKVYSAIFIILFAVTSSTAAWDFIMTVDPHWYSTLFGWYNFASCTVAGVAAITLIVLYLKSQGYLKQVNEDHYHNLGMLMFGFSVFWTYLWFSQYMLQWYANIPEETTYFVTRLKGTNGLFRVLFYANLILNFFFPFLFLMTRTAKRTPAKLVTAATIILIGHWIDYYLMVMPGSMGDSATIGFTEIFIFLGFAGAYAFVVLTTLSKASSLVPVNNPFAKESMVHHTLK